MMHPKPSANSVANYAVGVTVCGRAWLVAGDGNVTLDEFITAKLAEFAADDDDLFETCCGGARITMVEFNKKQARKAVLAKLYKA